MTADAETAAVRTQLEAALPDAQVMDYREGNPALTRGLDNATSILSLICLVAMVLGAIGVAMAMHAHLEQRMDMLAILKAIGADSVGSAAHLPFADAWRSAWPEALLGVAAGVGVMAALPAAFGNLLPFMLASSVSLAVGAGRHGNRSADHAALLSAAAARRARGEAGAGAAQACRAGTAGHRRLVCALVGAPPAARHRGGGCGRAGRHRLGAFRFTQSGRVVCSALHHRAGGSAGDGGCGAAHQCASCSIARAFILPSSLRHGLANLYRPGNQSTAVLAALGTGVMLILAVYLMQKGLLRDLRETASPKLPNVFLIDVRTDEVAGVKAFFAHQPGVSQPAEHDAGSDGAVYLHQRPAGGSR